MPDFKSTILLSSKPARSAIREPKIKAYLALAVICFFWGTTWLASKEGVKHMPAFQLAGIRQFSGGVIYIIYFLGRGNVKWPGWKDWKDIFILALFNFILTNGLATWGLHYISGGLAAIINAIVPLWLVVNSFFIKGPALSPRAVIGFAFGFAGICFIFFEHLHDFLNPGFSMGIIISLAATWTWAMGTIYTKRNAETFNPYFSVGLQMIISGIVLYSLSQLTGFAVPLKHIHWQAWLAIAYLVIFGSVISFLAYLYALQRLSAAQTSLYAYINPIVAVLLGTLLFNEKLTWFIAAGGLTTLYGVYLVNNAFKK